MKEKVMQGKPYAGNPHVALPRCHGGTGRFGEREWRCRRLFRWVGVLAVTAAFTARGEIVDFVGTAEPGELSNTANWSAATWGAAATQRVNGVSVAVPAGGFKLSAPLAAAARFWVTGFTSDATFDLGAPEYLNVQELYLNNNDKKTMTFSGNATNLTYLYLNLNTTLVLTNGLFHLATGDFYCYNWYDTIKICKGAELVVDKVNKNCGSGSNGQHAGIRIDNGRLTIKSYRDANWSTVLHGNNGDNFLEIVNGGVYYEAGTSEFAIKGPRTRFLIDNGGAYISTNASAASRNMKVGISSGTFAVTNGTLKTAQLYGGTYQGEYYANLGLYNTLDLAPSKSRFTFHNSRASFQFKPTSTYKGCFMFAGKAKENTVLLDGDDNQFDTFYLLMGGSSNRFTVAEGSFVARSIYFFPGIDNVIEFTGGHSVITNVYRVNGAPVDSFTNGAIKVSGTAELKIVNGMDLYGTNTSLLVSGGLLDAGASLVKFGGPCATYEATGGVVTGCLQFAANGGTVRIAGGAEHAATYGPSLRTTSLAFGENCADNVFVVSNATFTSRMPFMKELLTTDEGPKSEGIPFTNCPNCRIELRGETPKFLVTSNKRYASDGGSWYSFVLGNSHDPALLKDALRLRFVLPTNAYAEAPVRVTSGTAVLGGNAEFEFDATAFKWPARTTRIPLIYNANAFKGWSNRKYINIAGLNETNAGRLPEHDGFKSYFALSDDGKTLDLVVPGNGGTMVIFK